MTLKSEEAIATAMSKSYKGLTKERKEQLLSTVRAVHADKAEQLHGIFASGGLNSAEFAFYHDIVDADWITHADAVIVKSDPATPAPASNAGGPNGVE